MSSASPAAVPLFDSRRQFESLRERLLSAMATVAESGRYILGSECERLEHDLATYCGAAKGIACASGSDALLLALMACDVGPGDEVIVPTYTFFATASAVSRLGARPVFVDNTPDDYCIDPQAVEQAITPRTKAIIPVHLFGQMAAMGPLRTLAARHGLRLIEDAAQAIGAEDENGTRAGAVGDIGCFSFYPTKNLGCLGDGGLLTTNDTRLAERLALLRGHGMFPRYHHREIGINSRLDAIQAAVLLVKLPHLETWTERRRVNAARYDALFAEYGLERFLTLPHAARAGRHVWNQYIIRVESGQRDTLRQHLSARHIGTEIYYPIPLHLQECYQSLGHAVGDFPQAERAAQETLALPIFPELQAHEQQRVVMAVAEFFQATRSGAPIPRPKFLGRIPQTEQTPER